MVQAVRRRLAVVGLVLVLLLLMMVPIGPGAADSQACVHSVTGSIAVPVPTSGPPPFPLSGINIAFENVAGFWIYIHLAWIHPISAGDDFYLWATEDATVTGQELPDFNVAFYRDNAGSTQLLTVHNNVGPDKGDIPPTADRALIWMRSGPDSPTGSDGNHFGGEFNYRDQCGGDPAGSPWK